MSAYFNTGQSSASDDRVASPWQRLAAWVLDALICGLIFAPTLNVLGSSRPGPPGEMLRAMLPGMLLVLLYLVLFDGGPRGATPGKRILRLRVVDFETGEAIGYSRATVRRLAYVVGGLAFYAGWVWLIVDRRRQAFHDKVAKTRVIRTGS